MITVDTAAMRRELNSGYQSKIVHCPVSWWWQGRVETRPYTYVGRGLAPAVRHYRTVKPTPSSTAMAPSSVWR